MRQNKPNSVAEVTAYMKEIGCPNHSVESEKFFDYFESNGWKVGGRAAMKDWRAACRNWKRNVSTFNQKRTPELPSQPRSHKIWVCQYCGSKVPENDKYAHLQKCPKFKPADPKLVKQVVGEIKELMTKMGQK